MGSPIGPAAPLLKWSNANRRIVDDRLVPSWLSASIALTSWLSTMPCRAEFSLMTLQSGASRLTLVLRAAIKS